MKELRFGAIDIGSNAARLLISSVTGFEEGQEIYFKKAALVRSPLRLGFDAFTNHELSVSRIDKLIHSMIAYKHLLAAYDVMSFKAYATSAMREVNNSEEIIKRVEDYSGIQIKIISGHQEAQMVYDAQVAKHFPQNRPYLYIDVGGGSTEISIVDNGNVVGSRSFPIGTIRILNQIVTDELWAEMEDWVRTNAANYYNLAGIGLGGNINKIHKISRKPKNMPLLDYELHKIYQKLDALSLEERIRDYDMKTDRADVIVPAAFIFKNVMQWAECQEVYVPKIGLADGIIRQLYKEYNANH
jgi:exopolyphosphatase / guanosine-5'-triphosphate,3'-diphosphate pyrophosphatase